jgi:flagellar basal body-associated protein FliL
MAEELEEKMSEVTKILIAFVLVMIVGGIIIATSGVSKEKQASNAVLTHYSNMSRMAGIQCPIAVLKHTGEKAYVRFGNAESDKETYITLTYKGEKKFSTATCTIDRLGKVTKVVVDGKDMM